MIRTYFRPAEPRDLKAMVRGRGSFPRNLFLVSLPATLVIIAFIYLVWKSMVAALSIGAFTFLASVWSNVRFFRQMRRREAGKSDLHAVEVTDVSASGVLDIEALGSHGPAYVFFTGEGTALLLVGQWLLRNRSFPSTSFSVHRWADTKRPIRIESSVRRVEPQFSKVQLRPSYRFTDLEVFAATPDTLQHDLDRAFEKTA